MPVSSREIIKKLEQNGWYLDRVKGSHHHYKNSESQNITTVPHPKKDMPKGTLSKIEKQSGLKF